MDGNWSHAEDEVIEGERVAEKRQQAWIATRIGSAAPGGRAKRSRGVISDVMDPRI